MLEGREAGVYIVNFDIPTFGIDWRIQFLQFITQKKKNFKASFPVFNEIFSLYPLSFFRSFPKSSLLSFPQAARGSGGQGIPDTGNLYEAGEGVGGERRGKREVQVEKQLQR